MIHQAADAVTRFAPGAGTAPMVQLLDADGNLASDPPFAWDANVEDAQKFLSEMTLVRRLDTEGKLLQRQGLLSLWVELVGQEAVQVGLASALSPDDYVFPSYREHGLAMLMGLPTEKLLSTWSSCELCDWQTPKLRMANYQMVIGAQTLHAVGYAMGMSKDGDPGATVVIHGDGAASQGDVNESYIFAASYNAPIVFLCTNNQWAISTPTSRQTRVPPYQRAWGFGIPSVQVDGNDVFAVREVCSWALEQARSGAGPIMVEAFTYRMGAHTTSDDPSRYRPLDEVENWRLRDPISRVKAWLQARNAWSEADEAKLSTDADAFGARLRAERKKIAPTSLVTMFDHLSTQKSEEISVQQNECEHWLAGFEVQA